MTPESPAAASHVEVSSYFVRKRNAMALYADFGRIFEDHYLHLMQLDVRLEPSLDELLKEALASLALHLCSRPQNEAIAWTLNFREPPLNLFVTGDSQLGNVIGRVFTEDVKVPEATRFFSQVTRPGNPVTQSTVLVDGHDMLRLVEQYYEQSEQLPAKLFRQGGDAYAMVVAHPDIDMGWFDSLDSEAARTLMNDEELRLLERRGYRFACGCNMKTILEVVAGVFAKDPDSLFGGESHVEVHCPRCGGQFRVDPPTFQAHLDARKSDD
jgi:molecular chaperone Hsp33